VKGVVVPLKVSMMLADYAAVAEGKLFISGGGWSITGPLPFQHAIVVDIKVPWYAINSEHQFKIELLDADSQPVEVETPEGLTPLANRGFVHRKPEPAGAPR
jgi:hypothetical protein